MIFHQYRPRAQGCASIFTIFLSMAPDAICEFTTFSHLTHHKRCSACENSCKVPSVGLGQLSSVYKSKPDAVISALSAGLKISRFKEISAVFIIIFLCP